MARGRKTLYTPERVEKITKAIAHGETYKSACDKAGISEATFARWRENYEDFEKAIKKAEQEYNDWYNTQIVTDAKRSLIDLIRGTTLKTTKTVTKIVSGKKVVETLIEEKQVAPNPTAIIFALTNRAPEEWKNRQTTEVNANVKAENINKPDLSNIPDDLLEQVLNKINGTE